MTIIDLEVLSDKDPMPVNEHAGLSDQALTSSTHLEALSDKNPMPSTDLAKLSDGDLMSFTELSKLNDKALLKSLAKAVDGEIDQTTLVLRHLILVEERKLHARNHDSLFSFLTEKYRYSANAAQRRIDAARMLREFPSLESKIQSRAHSLTNLSLVRSLFRQEKKRKTPFSRKKKLEILSSIEGKSTRDAYLYLLTQSSAPELLKKCKSTVRALGNGYTAFKIVAHEELTADLYHLRDLWAHVIPDGNWTEIMSRMTKLTLELIDPLKKAERAKARKERSQARKDLARKERSHALSEPSKSQWKSAQARKDSARKERSQAGKEISETQRSHSQAHGAPSRSRQKSAQAARELAMPQKEVLQAPDDQTCNEQSRTRKKQVQKELVKVDLSAPKNQSTTGAGITSRVHSNTGSNSNTDTDTDTDTRSRVLVVAQADSSLEIDSASFWQTLQRRHIAAAIRHAVDLRDRASGCAHLDENGNRCGSHHGLEYDHIIPSALGGPDTVENLRLLCREHNSSYSYQVFGHLAQGWRAAHREED